MFNLKSAEDAKAFAETIAAQAETVRGQDSIVADDKNLLWFCQQLIHHPRRVDPTKTTNVGFLMVSAARTIAEQAAKIAELETAQ